MLETYHEITSIFQSIALKKKAPQQKSKPQVRLQVIGSIFLTLLGSLHTLLTAFKIMRTITVIFPF
ncbi:hypothetical protein C9I89_15905 [Photobacterium lipolyticum]|uniref:Uncharacterized protein n=1 Tax=Photobacterium lipolyticum TaxID=266810 RepID=A0A2T3MV82_9GAMM|nr:hypothetical protein C9I89_15905 [Photobacterium lipolyticum]